MKKTYMQPSLVEIKLNALSLLAGSDKGVSDETPKEWGAHEDEFEFE